jgi:hypothetical protein
VPAAGRSVVRLGCHRHADECDYEQDEETDVVVTNPVPSVAGMRIRNIPHAIDFWSIRSRFWARAVLGGGGSLRLGGRLKVIAASSP